MSGKVSAIIPATNWYRSSDGDSWDCDFIAVIIKDDEITIDKLSSSFDAEHIAKENPDIQMTATSIEFLNGALRFDSSFSKFKHENPDVAALLHRKLGPR